MSLTYHDTRPARPASRNYLAALARFVSARWRGYTAWRNQRLAIAALQRLDNTILKDIGIDRSEIGSVVRTGGRRRNAKRSVR